MRVTRNQIVHGIADYIKGDILPKLDKGVQIIGTIAVNAAMTNDKMIDSLFNNNMVKALLNDDDSGAYDVNGIADAVRDAIEQYGSFPVEVPGIPFISPRGFTVMINADDVDAMKRRIEG